MLCRCRIRRQRPRAQLARPPSKKASRVAAPRPLSSRAKNDDRFTSYTTSNGLPHNQVRAIHEDADGTLWIGTYGGGLARLKRGKFTTINSAAGLAEDVVSSILEDERGNFWMTGNRGVFRANREQLNAFADGRAPAVVSVTYGRADGLISAETSGGFQPASTRDGRGRMWFPTNKGLAMLDPAAALPETLPPGIAPAYDGLVIDLPGP